MFKFKTIFSRLIVIFIIILLVGYSVTSVLLYIFLGDFASNEKKNTLNQIGDGTKDFLEWYLENNGSQVASDFFSLFLDQNSKNTAALILVTDSDGNIGFSGPEPSSIYRKYPEVFNKLSDASGKLQLPDLKQHKKLVESQEDATEIGDFYGLFKDTKMPWLAVEKPFSYKIPNYTNRITGVVYLFIPLPGIQEARTSVFQFFMISMGAAILISVILVYIFSLKLSRPLKQINSAAKAIANGEFSKRVSVNSRDEIGELATSFNYMTTALQKLEDMRRGFIANVSHELRTPMTSIRGFVEGILDGTIPEEKQSYYLSIVRDETNRLNRLVNDLLDLARMEAGEVKLNPRSFNINELIRRCVIKLEGLIVKKDIQVNADLEQEDISVYADPDAIERVIFNLVHNAVKFTPEKGTITIGTATQKDKVTIWVEDTGIGIEKEEIDLIWDRFYKSDKSRSRDKTGTGLGLAIIKNLINEHKQRIWVDSEPGKGTRFTFTLDRVINAERTES